MAPARAAVVALARMALVAAVLTACASTPPPNHLAIANGNLIRIVDAPGGAVLQDVTRYTEVFQLGFRDDGGRLALADCFRNRVVELDATAGYAELGAPIAASSCPWDLAYSPGGQALAATVPARPSPPDALFCAGRVGTVLSAAAPCPCGTLSMPDTFTSNVADEATFITDLNGHALADSCGAPGAFAS